ncbi:MAG: hypothetical protein GY810_26060 [Aureispira sp.]|nr:hypothetical protein [Aureispira sp.]
MRYLWILSILLLYACNDETPSNNSTKVEPKVENSIVGIKDLDQLVDVFNGTFSDQKFIKNAQGDFEFVDVPNYAYNDVKHISSTQINIEFGSSEPSGANDSKYRFILMGNGENTKVLSIGYEGYSEYYVEPERVFFDDYGLTIEETEEAIALEKAIVESKTQQNKRANLLEHNQNSRFILAVWEKNSGTWIKKAVFPKEFFDLLMDYIPFLYIEDDKLEEQTTLELVFHPLSYHFAEANEAVFIKTFGKKLDYTNPCFIDYKDEILSIGTHKDYAINLKWTKEQFEQQSLPEHKYECNSIQYDACQNNLNFDTGKPIVFKGKIDNQHEFQMNLNYRGGEPAEAEGTYFYIDNPKEMQVKIDYITRPLFDTPITIIRKKEDKTREIFMGVWVDNCRIEGLWAHFGTLKSAPFYLDVELD